jgi:hypothetical protein
VWRIGGMVKIRNKEMWKLMTATLGELRIPQRGRYRRSGGGGGFKRRG